MREFKLATEASSMDDDLPGARPLEITVGDRVMVMNPPPNSGPFAYLMAMLADETSVTTKAYAVLRVLSGLTDEDSAKYLRDGLADAVFGFELLLEVYQYLMEEWTARPTMQPPASSRRQRSTGRALTGTQPSVA
jgi:hypothetical protein